MLKNAILLIASILSFFLASFCQAEEPLTLGTFAGPPLSTPEGTGFYDLVLEEAFARAGYEIEFIQLPAERSLTNANDGITDGDFVRISGLESIYPNLVRVPEKITDFEFVAFTKHVDIPIKGWESLKPYHVGIVRGWKILEENIVGTPSLVKVRNQNLLFTLLANDRTDIVVYSRFEGYGLISHHALDGISILEPPLDTREMYLYLNKKHSHLIPKIDATLKEMKRDGRFDQIRKEALSPYLPVQTK
jgi:polar amino acid transport system substrate-binding protein